MPTSVQISPRMEMRRMSQSLRKIVGSPQGKVNHINVNHKGTKRTKKTAYSSAEGKQATCMWGAPTIPGIDLRGGDVMAAARRGRNENDCPQSGQKVAPSPIAPPHLEQYTSLLVELNSLPKPNRAAASYLEPAKRQIASLYFFRHSAVSAEIS